MFAYSMREKTSAHRNLPDDVPTEVKQARLKKMIDVFMKAQLARTQKENLGAHHLVLVDGKGKKDNQLKGKTDTYRSVIFEQRHGLPVVKSADEYRGQVARESVDTVNKGDYVMVKVNTTSSNTLFGEAVCKLDFNTFFELSKGLPYFK